MAKRLSKRFTIPVHSLDTIVWDNAAKNYLTKNSVSKRNVLLKNILIKHDWIIEGVYVDSWTKPTFSQADMVIYLDVLKSRRYYRVIKRFILAKLGLGFAYEKSIKQVLIILALDKGWHKGIVVAGKNALRFTSADKAYTYITKNNS